ncbi:hypothetical protein [Endothiovibrio diazotrophicus]
MTREQRGGFRYRVSREQLEAFGKLTLLQRLEWLDQARRFTLMAETPESAARRERLRRGVPSGNDDNQ